VARSHEEFLIPRGGSSGAEYAREVLEVPVDALESVRQHLPLDSTVARRAADALIAAGPTADDADVVNILFTAVVDLEMKVNARPRPA
jgi:hypothetical protein